MRYLRRFRGTVPNLKPGEKGFVKLILRRVPFILLGLILLGPALAGSSRREQEVEQQRQRQLAYREEQVRANRTAEVLAQEEEVRRQRRLGPVMS